MQYDHVKKQWNLYPIHRVRWGFCGQNSCHHVAAFVSPFNLIYNMTLFWKVEFWPIDPNPGGGEGGSAGKIFATMQQHSWFLLIWYKTRPCSEEVEFWRNDLTHRVRGGLQAKYLLPSCSCSRDTLSFDMQHDYVLKKFNVGIKPPLGVFFFWGGGVSKQNICYHVAALIPFNLIWNSTLFW